MNNNDRSFFDRDCGDGNFNRNERMRGNSGNGEGRSRGPRQNWKDNDDGTHKNRNNRGNFDTSRDNRKSSRWGNHSPKSVASEENWESERATSTSPRKTTATTTGSKMNSANEKSSQEAPETDVPQTDSQLSDLPRISIKSPSKLVESFDMRNDETSSNQNMSAGSGQTDANRTNNETDVNTTPLYDEPVEDRSHAAKEVHDNEVSTNVDSNRDQADAGAD